MKCKSKLLVLSVLCSSFLGLHKINADNASLKNGILGVNSSRAPAFMKSDKNTPNSLVLSNFVSFVVGATCGVAGKKIYDDSLDGKKNEDDLKKQLSDAEAALKEANEKIEKLTSDLKIERSIGASREKKIKELKDGNEILNNKIKNEEEDFKHEDNNYIILNKEQANTLKKIIDQISIRVGKMGVFGEDCIGLGQFLNANNVVDVTKWFHGDDVDFEKLAWKAHATGHECFSTLCFMRNWLEGRNSFHDIEQSWTDNLGRLKKFDRDLCW